MRPWTTGHSSRNLEQIHLHVDDPSLAIPQKAYEQSRRDTVRFAVSESTADRSDEDNGVILPSFCSELKLPWYCLLISRNYKDEIASLHLICGAIAAEELFKEFNRRCTVFLHGGSYLPVCFANRFPSSFVPRTWTEKDRQALKGSVILELSEKCNDTDHEKYFAVPRAACIILPKEGG